MSTLALDSVVDLDKLRAEEAETIERIWTEHHSTKEGCSACIPTSTYETMIERAREHPNFVLPVLRGGEKVQFQFLQWRFGDEAAQRGNQGAMVVGQQAASTMHGISSVPSSTVLITSLDAFKTQGTAAQPSLTLEHFPELSETKGLVLMRGSLHDHNVDSTDAKWLANQLSLYYLAEQGTERAKLLDTFTNRPEEFEWGELLSIAT